MAKVKLQFPNIYRSFTERFKKFNKKNSKLLRQVKLQSVLTLYILTAALIVFLSIDLLVSLKKQKEINFERSKIELQIGNLKSVLEKYPNSKDVYFQLANLEYKIGNFDLSKYYVSKALYLDPNFGEAKNLQNTLRGY